jgi:head-tail adaptor
MPIWGKLSNYSSSNSQSRQVLLAEQQQSYVLYKFLCDFRRDIQRGCRVRKLDPDTGEPDTGPATEVFVLNAVPVANRDHLVCVCEEKQHGFKIE